MNRTDRLLAIILELQQKGTQRAEDLAATFETSTRTIYRDMQALSEARVPIIGAPGQGYSLAEGYFLPPVSLTAEEAATLLLGIDFIEQQFDFEYRSKAKTARDKIEVILPKAIKQKVKRVRQGLKLLTTQETVNDEKQSNHLAALRSAVIEERKIHFHYVKQIADVDGNRESERTVDPYALVYVNHAWGLIAFCNLRQHIRHFRLNRMSELTLLEERFIRPPDFNLRTYKPVDDRNIKVQIIIDAETADQWQIQSYYYTDSIVNHDKGLLVTLRVRQVEEVLSWVLSFGPNAVVLGPDSLIKLVREKAEALLKRY